MIDGLEHLESEYDLAEYLQNMLVAQATNGLADNNHYQEIRSLFLENNTLKELLPRWVKTNRNLSQFWEFIKHKFSTYAERRQFIWVEFNPLLEYLENSQNIPAQKTISQRLLQFDVDTVHFAWQKALERKVSDPEGAITISRTILETVCKHILDELEVEYDANKVELHQLYKLTADQLNLSPEQHSEKVFKQILGGCSAVVNGLGTLRNRYGDAHGKGKKPIKPAPRHAELAVNLAGTMAMFLVETYLTLDKKDSQA